MNATRTKVILLAVVILIPPQDSLTGHRR